MKRGLILFILIIQNALINAQSFYCKTIGISDGLSQSGITCIACDEEGSMWIGTRYGLNECRGDKIRTFLEGGENSISGNHVQFLFMDGGGGLWCATDAGLSYYDKETDEFTLMQETMVYSAMEMDGDILFGTANGVICYDTSSKTFHVDTESASSYIIDIYERGSHRLLVDRGLGLFTDDTGNHLDIAGLEGKVIMDSELDGDTLYLAVFKEGLYIVDLNTLGISKMDSSNSGLTYDVILSLMTEDDKMWIGTDGGGICIMDRASRKISAFSDYFIHYTGQKPDNSITTLYKDPHGNIWAGSVRNGLFGIKPTDIRSFTSDGSTNHSLSHNVINSICQDSEGIVWIGTDGGGVNRYDPVKGSMYGIHSTAKDKISSIADYDVDRLLISVYSQGCFLLDKKTGSKRTVVIVDQQTNAAECFTGNSPMVYRLDDDTMLFLAINAYTYDKRTRRFTRLTNDSGISVAELRLVGDDGKGKAYAISSYGLFCIDMDKAVIRCILEDGRLNTAAYMDGEVWLGTDSGMMRLDISDGRTSVVDTPLFKRITQLCRGADDDLWIAADNTLFHYKEGRFELFGENAGFASNEILCSMESTTQNTVFMGGTAGLVEIQKSGNRNADTGKSLKLHEVTVKGKRVSPGDKRLVLPYNFSTLTMSVNLMGSDPFEKTIYRFIVDGTNKSVIETYEEQLQLHSLKSGRYEVRASFLRNDGLWSTPETLIRFRVNDRWYRTTLFQVIVLFLIACFFVLLASIWYNKKVMALEADLHAKDLSFTTKMDSLIEENIANPELDVPMLANALAMSRAALYSKVKNSTGRPVAQYIEEKRMELARRLLQESSMSITEISEKVGFSSPKYFSTRFKAVNGLSPNAFRKQNGQSRL